MMANSPAAAPDCHSRGSLLRAALPKRPPRAHVEGTIACGWQFSPHMLPLRDRWQIALLMPLPQLEVW